MPIFLIEINLEFFSACSQLHLDLQFLRFKIGYPCQGHRPSRRCLLGGLLRFGGKAWKCRRCSGRRRIGGCRSPGRLIRGFRRKRACRWIILARLPWSEKCNQPRWKLVGRGHTQAQTLRLVPGWKICWPCIGGKLIWRNFVLLLPLSFCFLIAFRHFKSSSHSPITLI